MNKNAIEKFAVWARTELIRQVSQRAYQYGVTAEDFGDPQASAVNGRVLSNEEKKQRAELIKHVQQKGYDQTMEEMAYTWFNRFTALRFMEVNNYLPTHIRVFTNMEGEFKPDILSMALTIDLPGIDREKAARYIDESRDEDLYRYLLLTQCNALSEPLPGMFEKLGSYTELLLPNNILRQDSVIGRLISDIPEEDWKEQVEIIGWLYQYYISERHEEVVNVIKSKAVKKEDIPAATQLFTTDWVVRYIVDNSLGRYWIERHPESTLADKLEFLVMPKSGKFDPVEETVRPEDMTFFDPCMGSGHILVYAFDVLMEIYKESGFSERDAAAEIVKNNLFGLDIDDRCSQLAYFAVMMKGRSYDRRFFTRGITPHVMAIQESDALQHSSAYSFMTDAEQNDVWDYLLETFADAKGIGTLQTVKKRDYEVFLDYLEKCEKSASIDLDFTEWARSGKPVMECLVKQAEIMCEEYTVICTNPPYLNKLDDDFKKFINKNYKDFFGDLFSVSIYRNLGYCKADGYVGFMTPFVWMFIKTYEKLREFIIQNKSISTLIQMEYSAFEEATVPICSFVLQNCKSKNRALCFRLSDFKGGMEVQREKVLEAIANPDCGYFYESDQSNFSKIPGSPVAYWVGEDFINIYNSPPLSDLAVVTNGMFTCDNKRFLRMWHEVDLLNIFLNCKSKEDCKIAMKKWYPYNKGGEFRKWYGNHEYIINFFNFGTEISDYRVLSGQSGSFPGQEYYFAKSISWSLVSSSKFGVRFYPSGFVFDIAGSSIFPNHDNCFYYILAFLSTAISVYFLELTNPTINFQVGDIKRIPIVIDSTKVNVINNNAIDNIKISNSDWDSYETSWDFKKHPMV